MPVFDVLLMKQSVSHKSARALILIINALILNNNPNKGTYVWSQPLSTLINCHSFRLNLRSQNLGQQSLTRCSNLHTKKKKCSPTPFSFCELLLAGCQKASLCLCLLCHISSSEYTPQPHPIMPVKENKAGMSL